MLKESNQVSQHEKLQRSSRPNSVGHKVPNSPPTMMLHAPSYTPHHRWTPSSLRISTCTRQHATLHATLRSDNDPTVSSRPGALEDLLAVTQASQRGLDNGPSTLANVDKAVDELARLAPAPDDAALSATWKLLWTTEKVLNQEMTAHLPNTNNPCHPGNALHLAQRLMVWHAGRQRLPSGRRRLIYPAKRHHIPSRGRLCRRFVHRP